MSSRDTLWFCHGCQNEMTPLMVPDPVCQRCNSSFVEKIENPDDDPRAFAQEVHDHSDDMDPGAMPQGLAPLLYHMQSLMDRGLTPNTPQPRRATRTSPSFTFEINDQNGQRTIRLGTGTHPLGRGNGNQVPMPGAHTPNMSTFIHSDPQTDHERPSIAGALMAQYLTALLGNHDHSGMLFGMPGNGRMGDYVFNQEALDQVITQIMENSNSHRPVPATEEIMNNLPREVLMEGSLTLGKDCAVCKDQFKLETEDPDEQVVVTLPCQHPFHEPCISPWLKSSGTCPVCRHALVPQPEHHSMPPRPGSVPEGGGSGGGRSPTQNSPDQAGPSGLFQSFFGFPGALNSNMNGNTGNRSPDHDLRSPSQPRPASARRRSGPPHSPRGNNDRGHFPGNWADELD